MIDWPKHWTFSHLPHGSLGEHCHGSQLSAHQHLFSLHFEIRHLLGNSVLLRLRHGAGHYTSRLLESRIHAVGAETVNLDGCRFGHSKLGKVKSCMLGSATQRWLTQFRRRQRIYMRALRKLVAQMLVIFGGSSFLIWASVSDGTVIQVYLFYAFAYTGIIIFQVGVPTSHPKLSILADTLVFSSTDALQPISGPMSLPSLPRPRQDLSLVACCMSLEVTARHSSSPTLLPSLWLLSPLHF